MPDLHPACEVEGQCEVIEPSFEPAERNDSEIAHKLVLAKQLNEWACEADLMAVQISVAVSDSEKSMDEAVCAFLRVSTAVYEMTQEPAAKDVPNGALAEISAQVDCTISALQFHDLLRQRLEHIADTLQRSSAQHRMVADRLAFALRQPDNLFDVPGQNTVLANKENEGSGVTLFADTNKG